MVIDTSSVVAILNGEADALELTQRLLGAPRRILSAANHVELSMVVARGSVPDDLIKLDNFLRASHIEIVDVTLEDALIARDAFLRFGKGRHAAGLNFGDCFAYALSQRLDEPLLFKGNDFALTDVRRA